MPQWNPFSKKEEGKPTDEQSKAEIDSLVDRIGSSLEERFKPMREEFSALKTKFDDIEKAASAPPPPDPATLTEEDKARNERQAAIGISVQTNARLTERECLDEVNSAWSHLVPKIREYYAQTPLNRKAQSDYPDYCRNIIDMVIGKAAKEAGLRYDGQNKSFFLEDKSTSVTEPDGPLSDPNLVWHQQKSDGSTKTWSVNEQLNALGIDPKKFSENVKRGVV